MCLDLLRHPEQLELKRLVIRTQISPRRTGLIQAVHALEQLLQERAVGLDVLRKLGLELNRDVCVVGVEVAEVGAEVD